MTSFSQFGKSSRFEGATAALSKVGFGYFNFISRGYAHPARNTAIWAVVLLVVLAISSLIQPQEAEAIPPLIAILGIGTIAVAGFTLLDGWDPLAGPAAWLRDLCNLEFGISSAMTSAAAEASALDTPFHLLFSNGTTDSGLYDAMYAIHHTAVIPIANIVLIVFFVWGLMRQVSKMSSAEAGIDLVQLLLVWVWYGVGFTVVNASWEIMILLYMLSRKLIADIIGVATAGQAAFVAATIPDDLTNVGALVLLVIFGLVLMLVSFIVVMASQIVIMVRALQIYLYSAASPVAFAFMVSDGGRDMTKSFLKKYLAILLSGAILVILYFAYATICGFVTVVPLPSADAADVMNFAISVATPLMIHIAFLWAFFKSGSWARDLVGL